MDLTSSVNALQDPSDNTHITPQKYFLYQIELEFEVLVIKESR